MTCCCQLSEMVEDVEVVEDQGEYFIWVAPDGKSPYLNKIYYCPFCGARLVEPEWYAVWLRLGNVVTVSTQGSFKPYGEERVVTYLGREVRAIRTVGGGWYAYGPDLWPGV